MHVHVLHVQRAHIDDISSCALQCVVHATDASAIFLLTPPPAFSLALALNPYPGPPVQNKAAATAAVDVSNLFVKPGSKVPSKSIFTHCMVPTTHDISGELASASTVFGCEQ
jgi:hypothetical protein